MSNDQIDSSRTQPLGDVEGDQPAITYPITIQKQDQRKDDARMARIEEVLESLALTTAQNTTTIKAVQESTSEVVEIFEAMKGGVKVLGWLGAVLKWLAPVIAAYAGLRQAGWWPFR